MSKLYFVMLSKNPTQQRILLNLYQHFVLLLNFFKGFGQLFDPNSVVTSALLAIFLPPIVMHLSCRSKGLKRRQKQSIYSTFYCGTFHLATCMQPYGKEFIKNKLTVSKQSKVTSDRNTTDTNVPKCLYYVSKHGNAFTSHSYQI